MAERVRVPLRALAFDTVVEAAGLLVTVVALVRLAGSPSHFPWALLAVIPVVGLMARYPLVLRRRHGRIEIGLDCIVLVFVAMLTNRQEAITIWTVATVLVQLSTSRSWDTRIFNAGLCVVAGAAAVDTMWVVAPLGHTGVHELAAVGAGCAVYFVVDFVLTGISIALACGERLRDVLLDPNLAISLVCFLAVDALGWLAALTKRTAPFGLPLLAAPIGGFLLAVYALSQAQRDRGRLEMLFDTARSMQRATTTDDVEGVLLSQAAELLSTGEATLRAEPAAQHELGAPLGMLDEHDALRAHEPGAHRWLVVSPRVTGTTFDDVDVATLNTLAALGGESLHRARLDELTTHMARHDALTGLANRAVLRERLDHAIRLRARDGAMLAVVYADLDGFKAVNDTMGHEAGDELLVLLAARLRSGARDGDTIARLGGDEFAVLLESVPDRSVVEDVANRLLAAVSSPLWVRGSAVRVGASIGYALREDAEDATEMLRHADVAMYHVKGSSKNGVAGFTPAMLTARVARVQLERELTRALEEDQLRLHYQPVVDLVTGEAVGAEALLRWAHPGHGLMGPAGFISVAEDTGLIDAIGLWVLRNAHREAAVMAEAFGRPMSIAVNVAARQLRDPALVATVAELLEGGRGPQLVLEVTESGLVSEAGSTKALASLRELGAKIAVDDFGTGYSSFAYLRSLPVDILKLDRQFVVDAADDPRAAGIVEAVAAMARTLDLELVAEGIETQRQAQAVLKAGCLLGQGYLYARPMPAVELSAMLKAGRCPTTGGPGADDLGAPAADDDMGATAAV